MRGADGLVEAERAWSWDGRAARGAVGPAWGRLLELVGPAEPLAGVAGVRR